MYKSLNRRPDSEKPGFSSEGLPFLPYCYCFGRFKIPENLMKYMRLEGRGGVMCHTSTN